MSPATSGGTLSTSLAAWAVATDAAAAAGVDIRELHGTDVTLAQEVIGQVWGPQLIPQEVLLRALAHAGCTLLGAVLDGQPIGVTLGFLGWKGGIHLHSHMTAVVPAHRSTGVGYAAGWHAYLDRLADQLSGAEITNWSQRFDELIGEYQAPNG